MKRWSIEAAICLGLVAAVLAPSLAFAGAPPGPAATWNAGRCDCSTTLGDGQFLSTDSVTIDSRPNEDTSDWQSIINDYDQIVCDDSSGNDEDMDGTNDRDTVVQSTGRDLEAFAFGWDSSPTGTSYVKFFTQRYASTSNVQSFAYYGDVDNDFLLDDTDIVIGVTWSGSNGTIYVGLYQYTPADANGLGGDCLHDWDPTGMDGDPDTPDACDGTGFVDGYDMPGLFTFQACSSHPSFNNAKCEADTGHVNGVQMEFATTWNDLLQFDDDGTSPGFPIIFHVSSSNASLGAASWPAQIDDNLGGCGGTWGSSQFGDGSCTVTGDSDAGNADGTVEIAHVNQMPDGTEYITMLIDNDSNGPDTFDIAASVTTDWVVNDSGATSTQAPTWEFFLEDGTTAGFQDSEDTDITGTLETNELDEDGGTDEFDTLYARYTMPGPTNAVYDPSGDAEITVTLTSQAKPAFSMTCTNTVTALPMPDYSLTKTSMIYSDPLGQTAYEIPGSVIEYLVTIDNDGGGLHDQNAIWISDEFPVGVEFAVDDLTCADHTDGPVCLIDGGEASGLLFTAANAMYDPDISDTTDYVDFSNVASPDPLVDADWTYTPTDPDMDGYDPAVTAIRVKPPAASTDQFNATTSTTVGDGAPSNPSFQIRFRVRVQ